MPTKPKKTAHDQPEAIRQEVANDDDQGADASPKEQNGSYLSLLSELFDADDEITIEDDSGETFTGTVKEAAAFADKCEDPFVDLVTTDGIAAGLVVQGDPRKALIEPTLRLDGQSVYLLSNSEAMGYKRGEHWLSLIDAEEFLDRTNAEFDDLEFYDVSKVAGLVNSEKRMITLMAGRSRQEKQGKWKPVQSTMGQFMDSLATHEVGKKDGPCFLQGESIDGVRKAVAMVENHVIGIDLDSGAPLEDVRAKIEEHNLECVIYSTHSHTKDTSVITRDDYYKKMDTDEVDEDSCRQYLTDVKGVLPEIVEKLEIIDTGKHTSEGIVIVVKHKPMPKFRAVFPLNEPFNFAKRGGSQKDAIKEWKGRYAGFCEKLALHYDPSCCDPARLYYLPRCPKDVPPVAVRLKGDPVDLDDYKPVNIGRRRGKVNDPENVFTKAAGDAEPDIDGDSRSFKTDCGFDVLSWAKKRAKYFEIEDCLRAVAPDMIREDRGTNPGTHVECAFESDHTEEGGLGTFVVNASDNYDEGYDGGFTIKCVHNSCYDRDRLDFMVGFINDGIITPEDLKNPDFYMDVEELEEEEDAGDGDIAVKYPAFAPSSDDDFGDDELSMLEATNRRFSLASRGKDMMVLQIPRSADEPPEFKTSAWLKAHLQNRYFFTGKGNDQKKVRLFNRWLEWEDRREYREAVFAPGRATPRDVYNLFQGWAVEPRKGEWNILRDHIFHVWCAGNESHFEWVMTWLAQIFQQPETKMGSALVICGKKGCGKSIVGEFLGSIMGRVLHRAAVLGELTQRFNGHLEHTLLHVTEEAEWLGEPATYGRLKNVITAKTLTVERKNIDSVQVPNFTRCLLFSNEPRAVPVTGDNRRLAVFNCAEGHKTDFAAMKKQMASGGLEAMLFDLLNYKPKHGWDILRKPPKTTGLEEQRRSGLSPEERVIIELIEDGELDIPGSSKISLNETLPTEYHVDEIKRALQEKLGVELDYKAPPLNNDIVKSLVERWMNAECRKTPVPSGKNKKMTAFFPPLSEIRKFASEAQGISFD